MEFLSPKVVLYLYKFTIRPCLEYSCQPSDYLEWPGQLQKWMCSFVGSSLATFLEPLVHHRNVASLTFFYGYYFQVVPIHLSRGRSNRYSDRSHDSIPRDYKDICDNCFSSHSQIVDSLPIECFPLSYYLDGCKSTISGHLLTVGSF